MAFFGVPLSGLIASQNQLTSVSNNLANLDTVGFKDQTVSFSDLFAQSSVTNASNDPIQTGLGVAASQTNSDFTDGGISSTGIASNAALSGDGFFVVQGTNGTQSYSRAGDFTANANGYLTAPSGEQVLGYGATNGVVSTTGVLQPLNVKLGSVIPATATSQFQITANLYSNSAVGSTFSSTTPVYDSLGAQHVLTVTYTKTASNEWSYSVSMPKADLTGGSAATAAAVPSTSTGTIGASTDSLTGSVSIQLGSQTAVSVTGANVTALIANINGNATLQAESVTASLNAAGTGIVITGPSNGEGGNLTITQGTPALTDSTTSTAVTFSAPTTASPVATVLTTGTLNFDSSGNLELPSGSKTVSINIPGFADGGASTALTWNLADANGNGTITQTDLGSSTAATQNGQGSGSLTSYAIQADGTIEGTYSNGQTNALGQIAIASFANTQGLLNTGGNDYQATPGSGLASIGVAGTGGRGTITGGSVEASNVDVAAEFSKLIVAQQAYSANAKTITTFQQVSEATIAMIQ